MGRRSESAEGFSVSLCLLQITLISGAFYLWTSPLLHPVKLMVVLFHEMSHGLMAIATGGKVLNIIVSADEGGACNSEGGIGVLIVSAGYLGSMFLGGLILYLSRFRGWAAAVYLLLTMLLATAIFTVLHDPYTRRFATGLAGSFIFLGLLLPRVLGALFLRLLGTVSCLYVIFDIYTDILATSRAGAGIVNDAVAFAQMTGLSPKAVGLAWLLISLVYFFTVLRIMMLRAEGAEESSVKAAAVAA